MLFKSVPVTTMSRSTSDSRKISRPAVLSWMSQCPLLQPLIISSRDTCPSAKDKKYTTTLRTTRFQQTDPRLRYTEILSVPGLRIFETYWVSIHDIVIITSLDYWNIIIPGNSVSNVGIKMPLNSSILRPSRLSLSYTSNRAGQWLSDLTPRADRISLNKENQRI